MKVKNEQTTVFSKAEVKQLLLGAAGLRDDSGARFDFEIPDQVTLTYSKETTQDIRPPQVKR
jgi:hypothetical protein